MSTLAEAADRPGVVGAGSRWHSWLRQPLLSDAPLRETLFWRLLFLLAWTATILWLARSHVPLRDEVRALSLALSGGDWGAMLSAVQGEGHPFLWYIILRGAHDLFGVREVLPAAALIIGLAAVALLLLRAPFRLLPLFAMAFGLALGYEYVVVARNYGIAALVMIVIAASWQRIRDRPWLGLLLLLLCNTNVPSVFVAGGLYLYRLLELWGEQRDLSAPEWRRAALNGLLLVAGAVLAFVAVYPTANEAAAVTRAAPITLINLLSGPFDTQRSFTEIGLGDRPLYTQLMILLPLLLFIRRPRALLALLAILVALKSFFFMVYPAYFRHSALYFMALITFAWIEARREPFRAPAETRQPDYLVMIGSWFFLLLFLAMSLSFFANPVRWAREGRPLGEARRLAAILERPELRGATLMTDPDTMGEAVVYHTNRPYWLIRQGRLGRVTPLLMTGNKDITLDTILSQARSITSRTGKPVVIAFQVPLDRVKPGRYDLMFRDYTTYTNDGIARFRAATRPLARLNRAQSDEEYDVYVYPR
jgi:hypothetical protein